jgi:dinuclear metal center YbgI/SA1388 family protein
MKPSDIIHIIEETAPPEFAASWDNSGVQVAALREEIRSLAVLLEPTPEKLGQAVEAGADFILAHHPLLMQPRYPNRADSYLSILSLLFTHDIWLYSAHTSLDANPEGPVRWLAHDLGLQSLELLESAVPLGPKAALSGYGFSGTLPKALSYDDFCRSLAAALGKNSWQACGPRPARIFRVACCPGAGNSLLADAAASGADVYITGDVKYHTALEAVSLGLHVLDVGHFILEEKMMRHFAADLAATLPLPVHFISSHDPITVERAMS